MAGTRFTASEYDIWLGQNISVARRMLGLSQKDVAQRTGVTFQQIQKYETAGNRLSATTLKKIADAFDMTVGQLADGGVTGRFPHDKYVLQIMDLIYSQIKQPKNRKILLEVAHCIAATDRFN